jgi:hypothetical protein
MENGLPKPEWYPPKELARLHNREHEIRTRALMSISKELVPRVENDPQLFDLCVERYWTSLQRRHRQILPDHLQTLWRAHTDTEVSVVGMFELEIDFETYPFAILRDMSGTYFVAPAPTDQGEFALVLDEEEYSYTLEPPDQRGYCQIIGVSPEHCEAVMARYKENPADCNILFV